MIQATDPGQDGLSSSTYAKDAFGEILFYYSGDYNRTGKDLNQHAPANTYIKQKGKDLYNGNICAISTYTGFDQTASNTIPSLLGQGFRYDVLNRLVSTFAETKSVTGFAGWTPTTTALPAIYQENMKYDANGNIDTLIRTSGLATPAMDNMHYKFTTAADFYGKQKKTNNKLQYIQDAVDAAGIEDIINQAAGNYVYDAKGRLITDLANQIQTIKWTAYDKVAEVIRTTGSTKPYLKFTYDASGKRVSKTVLVPGQNEEVTYYAYDAAGNTMATYQKSGGTTYTYTLKEQHIYGGNRVGLYENNNVVYGGTTTTTTLSKNQLRFELTDHLGNVRAVVSGLKVNATTASIQMLRDYYPFGMEMPGRKYTGDGYRYRFNGVEKNDEFYGEGNEYSTEFRELDVRIGGRWWSPDPIVKPWESPYAGFSNNPILYIDPSGLDPLTQEEANSGCGEVGDT